jgi:hypothetical protein
MPPPGSMWEYQPAKTKVRPTKAPLSSVSVGCTRTVVGVRERGEEVEHEVADEEQVGEEVGEPAAQHRTASPDIEPLWRLVRGGPLGTYW